MIRIIDSISEAVRQFAGGGAWFEEPPANTPLPYVVFSFPEDSEVFSDTEDYFAETFLVEFIAYARTLGEACSIGEEIKEVGGTSRKLRPKGPHKYGGQKLLSRRPYLDRKEESGYPVYAVKVSKLLTFTGTTLATEDQ